MLSMPRIRHASVVELLRQKSTETPVFCYFPHRVRSAVQEFVRLFPGEVLYAVKANPDPELVRWVIEGGVRGFDVASLTEIALVRAILPEGRCAYNHPVKSRQSIRRAYRDFGVRDFVVDHAVELEKLLEEAGTDITVQVRVAAPNAAATVSFNEKFGATPADAAALMRRAIERGARAALAMHVGWQTTDPQAYANGIGVFAQVSEAAAVRPAYLNVGGGFPSVLMPRHRTLKDFMDAIAAASTREFAGSPPPLRCEPGSALVTSGGAVLTQVLLAKDAAVYLNDGIYGALAELTHSKIQPPTRVLTRDGEERTGPTRRYRVFGPTCDSTDETPAPFDLPVGTREGDWLLLEDMGAYSAPLITNFNGLGEHDYAIIGP
jgi:ornithine decarboxylase